MPTRCHFPRPRLCELTAYEFGLAAHQTTAARWRDAGRGRNARLWVGRADRSLLRPAVSCGKTAGGRRAGPWRNAHVPDAVANPFPVIGNDHLRLSHPWTPPAPQGLSSRLTFGSRLLPSIRSRRPPAVGLDEIRGSAPDHLLGLRRPRESTDSADPGPTVHAIRDVALAAVELFRERSTDQAEAFDRPCSSRSLVRMIPAHAVAR